MNTYDTSINNQFGCTDNCIIDITGIHKIYKLGKVEVVALRGIDLKISKGEFISIMGPSGSGKSTLMNILGCLDTPDRGTYLLENTDVSKLNDDQLAEIRNKKIGFVFQTFNLLSRSNSLANIELPLIYSKKNKGKSRREKIYESLRAVGLIGWEKHKPSELSGGQRQRVAIARALVNDPAIILADEPTGNLDSVTGEEIMAIFQKLNQMGKTILLVTHELDIAKHTRRIIYLRDGLIFKEEKIEHPINAEETLRIMPRLEDKISANKD
jgi:putative ABC transport system ATP-binding protein